MQNHWFIFIMSIILIITFLLLLLVDLRISIPIAILLIILDLYFFLKYREQNIKQDALDKSDFPPSNYMINVGGKCGDGWVFTGTDKNGNYTCENSRKIPTNSCALKQTFVKLNTFPLRNSTEQNDILNTVAEGAKMSRCTFIKNCGVIPGVPASWIGIDNLC